jgi:hypothetical protein
MGMTRPAACAYAERGKTAFFRRVKRSGTLRSSDQTPTSPLRICVIHGSSRFTYLRQIPPVMAELHPGHQLLPVTEELRVCLVNFRTYFSAGSVG